jgi:prepilin-type N-terminal cleavage/methylation domain-containing protein
LSNVEQETRGPQDHRRYRRRGVRGVTLIELLVAITLLSLLSVGLLMALRLGLNAYGKTQARLMDNRRVAGAQRILEEQLEGLMPVVAPCGASPAGGGARMAFFQGEPQVMRLVSTFSLQQAWRGQPQILEVFVIPGADGRGVRLVVNEIPYTGGLGAGQLCMGPNPGGVGFSFLPVTPGPKSFVLADKLAYCRFSYLTPPKEADHPPLWLPVWIAANWPLGVRVDMAPLDPDPSRLQPIAITAPIHIHRNPEIPYGDF